MTTWRAADQARALFYAQHPDAQLDVYKRQRQQADPLIITQRIRG